MSHSENSGSYVRRVVLPSGRAIEVVYFEHDFGDLAAQAATAPTHRFQRHENDLHVCPKCSRDMVHPFQTEKRQPNHWKMTLWCPNCSWSESVIHEQPICNSYQRELERLAAILRQDLNRLIEANMEDWIDRFVRALGADALLPEDF